MTYSAKLEAMGINFIYWFKSYLTNRKRVVKANDTMSILDLLEYLVTFSIIDSIKNICLHKYIIYISICEGK